MLTSMQDMTEEETKKKNTQDEAKYDTVTHGEPRPVDPLAQLSSEQKIEKLAHEQNISLEEAQQQVDPAPNMKPDLPSAEAATTHGEMAKLKAEGKAVDEAKIYAHELKPSPHPENDLISKIKQILNEKGLDIDPAILLKLSEKDLGFALEKAQSDNPKEKLGEMGIPTASSVDYEIAKELGVSATTEPVERFRVEAAKLDDGTSLVLDVNSERKSPEIKENLAKVLQQNAEPEPNQHDDQANSSTAGGRPFAPGSIIGQILAKQEDEKDLQQNHSRQSKPAEPEFMTPFSMEPKLPGSSSSSGG